MMTDGQLVRSISHNEFEAVINENAIVILDFWAPWCAPCRQFAQVYEKAAANYPQVVFAKINIEEESELAETFHIRSIPHVMVFKQGIVIYSEAGSMPASTLSELIEQALVADVSEIRAKLDAEKE